ncbi:putative exported protein [plant metagenome]
MKTVKPRGVAALVPALALVLGLLAGVAWAPGRGAQGEPPAAAKPAARAWPDRTLSILVTFPPGGGTDLLARKLGERLAVKLGVPVVVENRPGASGNIGARAAAEAVPDGNTLLMVNSSFAINPGVYRELPFDPKRDFAPVINVAFVPSAIVVPASSTWRTLADMIDAGRLGEAGVAYASCGNGTPQHLAGEMLHLAGVSLRHVPYKGCGPALTDAVAGQVPVAVVTASSAAPFIRAGSLRALAITAPARSALMPGVPTVAEQGFPGYALNQWHGLLAPAHTPPERVRVLRDALAGIVADPAMQEQLRQLGFDPTASTSEAFRALVHADIDRYGALTAQLGLRAD